MIAGFVLVVSCTSVLQAQESEVPEPEVRVLSTDDLFAPGANPYSICSGARYSSERFYGRVEATGAKSGITPAVADIPLTANNVTEYYQFQHGRQDEYRLEVVINGSMPDVEDQVVFNYWFDQYGDTCNVYSSEDYGDGVCELILPRNTSQGGSSQISQAETRYGGPVTFDIAIGVWDFSTSYCNARTTHNLDVRPEGQGPFNTGIMVVPRVDIDGAQRDGWTFTATPGDALTIRLTSDPYYKAGQVPELIIDGPGVTSTVTSPDGIEAKATVTPNLPGTYRIQAVDYTPVGAGWNPAWGQNTVRGDYELIVKYASDTGALWVDGAAMPAPGTYLADTGQALQLVLDGLPDTATGDVQFTLADQMGAEIALDGDGAVSLAAGTPARLALPGGLTPGTYDVFATYAGDDDHFESQYAATLTLDPAAVTAELAVEGAEAKPEADETFTAPFASELSLVLSGLPDDVDADITFSVVQADGMAVNLENSGTAAIADGAARLPLPTLDAGPYTLTAAFPGTSLLSENAWAATLEIQPVPVDPKLRAEGTIEVQDTSFTASETSDVRLVLEALPMGTDGRVSFEAQTTDGRSVPLPDATEIPVDDSGIASLALPPLEPGSYFLTARFSGDDNFVPASVSARLTIEVEETEALAPTEVRLAIEGAKPGPDGTGLVATFRTPLKLGLSGVPSEATGEVSFFGVTEDGALLPVASGASVAVDENGVVSADLPELPVGTYRFTGRFAGDDIHAAAEDTLELTVMPLGIRGTLEIAADEETRRPDIIAAEARARNTLDASQVRIVSFGAPVPVRFESQEAAATGDVTLRVHAGDDLAPIAKLGPLPLDEQGQATFLVETRTGVSRYRLEASLVSNDFEMTEPPTLDLVASPSSLFAARSAELRDLLVDHLQAALRTELRRRDAMMQDVRRRLDCDRASAETQDAYGCGLVSPLRNGRSFRISTPLGGFDAGALGLGEGAGLDGTMDLRGGLLRLSVGTEAVEEYGDRTTRLSGNFRFDRSPDGAATGKADGEAAMAWRKDRWRALVRLSGETQEADRGLTSGTFETLAQAETISQGKAIVGAFGTLNLRRDDVERRMQGDIESRGGTVGLYGIQRLGQALTVDAYVQLGWTRHRVDVSDELLTVSGDYNSRHWLAGATLAGVHKAAGFVWRPRITASHAQAHAGTIDLDAEAWALTESVDLALGDVVLTDLTAASLFDILLNLGERVTVAPTLSITPSLGYRAWDLATGQEETGTAGLDVELHGQVPPNGVFSIRTGVEATDDQTRSRVGIQVRVAF